MPEVSYFHIRDLDAEADFPGLSVLCAEIEAADHLGADTSEAALRSADPKRKRWVIEDAGAPGRFAGHGWIQPQTPQRSYFFAGVRPDCRRQGMARALLAYALVKAKEAGAGQLAAYLCVENAPANAFLAQNGFVLMGHNRFMKASDALSSESPRWPVGFAVRTYAEVNDLALLVEAHNLCYTDHWGHYENSQAMTSEVLSGYMREYPDLFIPEGIFILFAPDGEIAGLTYGRLSADRGPGLPKTRIVDSPGTAPAYRLAGLIRPLTLLTLQWLRTQGEGPLELHCFGEPEDVVEIYADLGFRLAPADHWVEYVRPVP